MNIEVVDWKPVVISLALVSISLMSDHNNFVDLRLEQTSQLFDMHFDSPDKREIEVGN